MLHEMGNFGWGMGIGWIAMLIFWGLVILGIAMLVKYLWTSSSRMDGQEKALDILNQRYARGEIDSEEYQRKKADLEGS